MHRLVGVAPDVLCTCRWCLGDHYIYWVDGSASEGVGDGGSIVELAECSPPRLNKLSNSSIALIVGKSDRSESGLICSLSVNTGRLRRTSLFTGAECAC
jgi:hypothetical protein